MFTMILLWALAVTNGSYAAVCSSSLQGTAPDMEHLPAKVLAAAHESTGDTLGVHVVDDHRLLVVSHRSDLPDLTITGSRAKFPWHRSNGLSTVLLEQCGLARSALSLVAGPEYVEWVSTEFFEFRSEARSEAASLRTLSLSSEALGLDREIYLVIPEGWDGAEGDPLLISGDGLAGSPFGAIIESLAASKRSRPVAFASARFGEGMLDGAGVPLRSAEYHLPGSSASDIRRVAYAAHEKFFFEEFLPSIIAMLGGETGPIYTFGISSSASFALEQGLMRNKTIAGVIAASPPIHRRTLELSGEVKSAPTIQLWCGTLEEMFCNPIRNLAESHGYRLQTRQAAHSAALWEEALSASIIELFPPLVK